MTNNVYEGVVNKLINYVFLCFPYPHSLNTVFLAEVYTFK